MGFSSGFKGLRASGFTLERGGSSVVSRGLRHKTSSNKLVKLLHLVG